MYNVDYNLKGARVTKTNYITKKLLVSLFCIFENDDELQLAGALISYDISDIEHYYNNLYMNYTIAELIWLHISNWRKLITLFKWFSVVFMLKSGYCSSDKQLEID